MKTTIRISGIIATVIKVLDPAIASAADDPAPDATAAAFAPSYHFPIRGRIREVENMPAPPISESPIVPVLGRYSDTNPSMVGQKKHIPAAKTSAAPKALAPLALLSNTRPISAKRAENINKPFGFSR